MRTVAGGDYQHKAQLFSGISTFKHCSAPTYVNTLDNAESDLCGRGGAGPGSDTKPHYLLLCIQNMPRPAAKYRQHYLYTFEQWPLNSGELLHMGLVANIILLHKFVNCSTKLETYESQSQWKQCHFQWNVETKSHHGSPNRPKSWKKCFMS